jgi:nitroreductase
MQDAIKTIGIRKSCRNFSVEPVAEKTMQQIKDLLKQAYRGPLGNEINFRIIDFSKNTDEYNGKLGTYGIIKGARIFIGGAITESTDAYIDYGYCFEKIILELTEMGLGTCWMAVAAKKEIVRSTFESNYGISKNEMVPAVSPFGYAKEKDGFLQAFVRIAMRTNSRKAWEELFFDGFDGKPISKNIIGKYSEALDAVRVAPSAVNKQPWRVYKEKDSQNFHFYRKGGHPIDMGIAMLHFELAARQTGLEGEWKKINTPHSIDGMEYTLSWFGR